MVSKSIPAGNTDHHDGARPVNRDARAMQLPRPRRPAGDAPPTNRPLSTYLHRRVELTDEVMRADELEELPAASVRVVPNLRRGQEEEGAFEPGWESKT